MPDSGAQICLMPSATARRLFPTIKPQPTTQECTAANSSPLRIRGELDCILRCKDSAGQDATARAKFFVTDDIPETYISLTAMMDLSLIHI